MKLPRMRTAACLGLACGIVFGGTGRAAFDHSAEPPAERACSSADAVGMTRGSMSLTYHGGRAPEDASTVGGYCYRPFGISGLGVRALFGKFGGAGGKPGLGISYRDLAAPGYRETVLSLSLCLARGGLRLQPAIRYAAARAPGALDAGCVIVDILTYHYVTEGLRVSFGVLNALGSRLGVEGGAVPVRVRAGVGYCISDAVACGLSLEKENGRRTSISTGLEWRTGEGLYLRLGSRSSPREGSIGLGVRLKRVGLDLATSLNLDLGVTHEAGLYYEW
jgi:hypothetical protein